MMILATLSEKKSENSARVFWRVGQNKNGILDVEVDFNSDDVDIIAELIAIRYLIFENKIFDRVPGAGNGYKLIVSKGAIKKLVIGKSTKAHLSKFAAFLSSKLRGVTLEVSNKTDFMADPFSSDIKTIVASREIYTNTHESIHTPVIGEVFVTQHAVEQYEKRSTSGISKKPWLSLVRQLQHPDIMQIPLSEKVIQHKQRKYGPDDETEVWCHPDSILMFLIVKNKKNNSRTLVSVFERRHGV